MDLGNINQEKVYSALRSIYRYQEMTSDNAPEILISTESELLEKRFALLNAKEIFALIKFWPEYLTQQSVIDAADDMAFEHYLMSIN